MVLAKSALLDRTDSQAVSEYNELLKKYYSAVYGGSQTTADPKKNLDIEQFRNIFKEPIKVRVGEPINPERALPNKPTDIRQML